MTPSVPRLPKDEARIAAIAAFFEAAGVAIFIIPVGLWVIFMGGWDELALVLWIMGAIGAATFFVGRGLARGRRFSRAAATVITIPSFVVFLVLSVGARHDRDLPVYVLASAWKIAVLVGLWREGSDRVFSPEYRAQVPRVARVEYWRSPWLYIPAAALLLLVVGFAVPSFYVCWRGDY